VDNVTHAFVGAAMAECALPRVPPLRARLVFMCVGIVAANAPDVDVLYSSITEEPIGYLLHHRGHSHTLPGLAALGLLIWSGLRLLASTRPTLRETRPRLVLLTAAALLSHLLMDAGNSYGTHLFYPFSSRWVYGDAVFVIEPWLWVLLGTTLAMNATPLWRVLVVLLTLLLVGVLAGLGLLQSGVVVLLLGSAGAAAFAVRAWERRSRAAAVLIATAAMFVVMSGVSRVAKGEARRAAGGRFEGELVDVVADANPGVPWCWAVLTLRRATDGPTEALIARRGTLSLVPGLSPAASCPSARLSSRWSSDLAPSDAIVWHRQWRIDVEELRALSATNCRARAWLQFGRAPYVANGSIVDLRYENPLGQNFTPMALDGGGCPGYLTDWGWPRRDVLAAPSDHP
jgi:inner membrane protein